MSWVPKAEQNATWRIWNKLYKCRVSAFHSRSVEDVEHFGTPASGDSEFDKTMLTECRQYYKTTDQMVELFKRNIPVGLFTAVDAKSIYEDINDHLVRWQNTILKSPNIKPDNAVIDDLISMDKFASVVYPHAKPFFTTEVTQSLLLRRMTAIGLPASAFSDAKPKDEPAAAYEVPVRESLADIFAARRNVSSKSWRGG